MKSKRSTAIRLFGAPTPENFQETSSGKALIDSAKIHYSVKEKNKIEKLVALEKLAIDIFKDNQAARAFAVNPEEYMKRYGFTTAKFDLNSQEIKIAMAMGDPLVRETANKGDVKGFIDAIMAQGIKPRVGLGCFALVELGVYISVIAFSWVAAVATLETALNVHHKVAAFGVKIFDKDYHKDVVAQIAKYIGDDTFSGEVAKANIEKTIEKYIELMKSRANTEVLIKI